MTLHKNLCKPQIKITETTQKLKRKDTVIPVFDIVKITKYHTYIHTFKKSVQ